MLRALLRYPSPTFPDDLRTHNAEIDALLTSLDKALIGSAKVRRQTLIEVRDDLLEALERARDAGVDERAAVGDAISALGSIDAIASEQRSARAAMFRKTAIATGLTFATLMLGMQLMLSGVLTTRWPVLVGMFVFHALFFGLWMGYFAAYVIGKAEPSRKDSTHSGAFLVYYPPSSQAMSWALAIVFASMALGMVLGLVGISVFTSWSPLFLVVMLLLNIKIVLSALATAMFRACVEGETLRLQGLFGVQYIVRDRIRGVQKKGLAFRLLWFGAGEIHRIVWEDNSGVRRNSHVSINQELVHGDRLLAWLEAAAARNAIKG
jgi:hypothetical protein